ncbi:MAG: hypothetical protein WKF61_09055 [Luteimonas sp.]
MKIVPDTIFAAAFNKAYELLCDPKISGKHEYMQAYQAKVSAWIEC